MHRRENRAVEGIETTALLLSNVLSAKEVARSKAVGVLRVITDYTCGIDALDYYDGNS